MELNLVSDSGEEYWLNSRGWSYLLELAGRYGWEDEEHVGERELRFSDTEAASLADALEKALNDPEPGERLREPRLEVAMQEAGFISASFDLASRLDENRGSLKEFVEFSRSGGFVVQ
jgi:hypothetical protein